MTIKPAAEIPSSSKQVVPEYWVSAREMVLHRKDGSLVVWPCHHCKNGVMADGRICDVCNGSGVLPS